MTCISQSEREATWADAGNMGNLSPWYWIIVLGYIASVTVPFFRMTRVAALKPHPTQATEQASRLAAIQPSAEHTPISAEEPFILCAQAAFEIIARLLDQKRRGGSPAFGGHQGGRDETTGEEVAVRAT
jgi:hypothetical protein